MKIDFEPVAVVAGKGLAPGSPAQIGIIPVFAPVVGENAVAGGPDSGGLNINRRGRCRRRAAQGGGPAPARPGSIRLEPKRQAGSGRGQGFDGGTGNIYAQQGTGYGVTIKCPKGVSTAQIGAIGIKRGDDSLPASAAEGLGSVFKVRVVGAGTPVVKKHPRTGIGRAGG